MFVKSVSLHRPNHSGSSSNNDFSQGSMWRNILTMAVPLILAQAVQVLYNVVDRVYIGHLPADAALAFTGIGLTFPIVNIISAFTNLFGSGGAPLCSIARGRGDIARARRIMCNCFVMLLATGFVLMAVCYLGMKPILYLFGASDATWPFARDYLYIYLLGTPFVMVGLGMNSFVNAQGFGRMGMMTVALGAVVNLILDPIFIFGFNMGVQGAALATILSQAVSAAWVVRFLTGPKALFTLRQADMTPDWPLLGQVTALGVSGFVMAVTNSLTQIACNATLQTWGGDVYVGIMTVINSVRELFTLPVHGLTQGAQPVLSYNYGAGKYRRVRKGIVFMTVSCFAFTSLVWLVTITKPALFIRLFNSDEPLVTLGAPALALFFQGFFMMSFQFSGQAVYVALNRPRSAVFFSLLRKAVIRSDLNPIRIGRDCNVQDNATIHSNRNSVATLGNGVTVGHNAIVHGATIEDDVLVGMHATVLDGAHIGSGSIIAAGAVVLSGMEVPPNSLVAGVPGKILRRDDPHSLERTRDNAQEYILLAEGHAESEDLT